MRKVLPYIIAVFALIFLAAIIVAGNKNQPRKMDERITLKQKDKIPYGTAAAKTLLPSLFLYATIAYDNKSPGFWESVSTTSYNQAVILVSRYFNADEYELAQILEFAEKGNYVFIIARSFSEDAERIFNFSYSQTGFDDLFGSTDDSLWMNLEKPSFSSDQSYVYPGRKFESYFYSLDTARTIVLGRNENKKPNFIKLKRGNGFVFIHTAPLAFSNYFILHKNNIGYFEKVFSALPDSIEKIAWNEYYLTKPNNRNREKQTNWLGVLFRYPPFKWGLLTAMITLLLFVLLGMRRKQRMIPPYQKPKNDSLDFIKTMGRLYHDRRDHQNLAKKMGIYFLDHIRTNYKLATNELDENFIRTLHYKSGHPAGELREIISFINYLEEQPQVNENQLSGFHKQLELFYQNT